MRNIPSVKGEQVPAVKPVFFDPARKRWPRVRLGIALMSATLFALMGALILSIATSPIMPALNLPRVSFLPRGAHKVPPLPSLSAEQIPTGAERALNDAKAKLAAEQERAMLASLTQAQQVSRTPQERSLAIGFFVNWDDASTSSLKENVASLDMLIPEWLHLESENGTLREDDPNRQGQVMEYLRTHRPEIRIMPLVNNWNGKEWEGNKLARKLAAPAARLRAIDQLMAYVDRHRFGGLSIDFESIPAHAQLAFRRFIAQLYRRQHDKGFGAVRERAGERSGIRLRGAGT